MRLSQYLSRTLASSRFVKSSNRLYYGKLTSDISYIRKALRLFKSINHIKNIQSIISKAFEAKNLSLINSMNILKNLMYAGYLLFDNVVFLQKILKITLFKSIKDPAKLAPKFWALAISFALVADTKILLDKQKVVDEKKSDSEEKTTSAHKCAFSLCKTDPKLLKRVVWDILDLYLAGCASNIFGKYQVEHLAALAGFFTSVFGVQEILGL